MDTSSVKSPLFVAEIGANHLGSLSQALTLVEAAARAGAHAIKLQTYSPESIAVDRFIPSGPWAGRSYHDLYRAAMLPRSWHYPIFRQAMECGLMAFSTPFSENDLDFLEGLLCPVYKIASPEIIHLPLIRAVAATGKPLIISTGMAAEMEIATAVSTAREAGAEDITLLHCLSAYPAQPEHFNIATMVDMGDKFDCSVGLSDHSLVPTAAILATACGATVIEKHLTMCRAEGGPDSAFSLEPDEFAETVRGCLITCDLIGQPTYGPRDAEEKNSLQYRRSIWITSKMKKGEVLTEKHLSILRPADGLDPICMSEVLGKRVNCDIAIGTPMKWSFLT